MALKWGIISAGLVAHDFVNALKTWPEEEHIVVSVAARNIVKAKEFADRFDIPHHYGSYKEIAMDPNVEIAYVATLNPQHFELCMLMLEHGKHVVCEKPLGINEKQAKKCIEYAKSKNLFLIEGMWSRFTPVYQYLKKRLDENALGEVKEVKCRFMLDMASKDPRSVTKENGRGSVLDFGEYTIQAALWAFREYPEKIIATGVLNDDGVDLEMKGELIFSGGRKAFIETKLNEQGVNEFVIIGTKGRITIHQPFWSPTHLTDIDGKVKAWPHPNARYDFNYPNGYAFRYEQEAIKKAIRNGLLEIDDVSHAKSLDTHRIMDEIRREIGVHYNADDIEY